MTKSLESAVAGYFKARSLSPATGVEYRSTLSKWKEWNKEVPIESIGRSESFLTRCLIVRPKAKAEIPGALQTSVASI